MNLQKRMEFLARYGGNAREVLPRLEQLERERVKLEEGRPPGDNLKRLRKSIAEINASKKTPALLTLNDFIANPVKSRGKQGG